MALGAQATTTDLAKIQLATWATVPPPAERPTRQNDAPARKGLHRPHQGADAPRPTWVGTQPTQVETSALVRRLPLATCALCPA